MRNITQRHGGSHIKYKTTLKLISLSWVAYVAAGDLHTYLLEYGSIDALHSQFILGEVVAALCSVHEAGFVFNDLKVVNSLIFFNISLHPLTFDECLRIETLYHHLLKYHTHKYK